MQMPALDGQIDEVFAIAQRLLCDLGEADDIDRFRRFLYGTDAKFFLRDVEAASPTVHQLLHNALYRGTDGREAPERNEIVAMNKRLIETVLSQLTSIRTMLKDEEPQATFAEDERVREILKQRVAATIEPKEKVTKKVEVKAPKEPKTPTIETVEEPKPPREKPKEIAVEKSLTLEDLHYRENWEPCTEKQGYQPGDQFMYPGQGVCEVVDREEKFVAGNLRELLVLAYKGGKIMVPVENAGDQLTPLMRLEGFEDLKLILQEPPVKSFDPVWSRRSKAFQEKMSTGNTLDAAEVLRDLLAVKKRGKLSQGEHRILQKARIIIYGELAIVCGRTEKEVEEAIESYFLAE